jgi:hypothetical protein
MIVKYSGGGFPSHCHSVEIGPRETAENYEKCQTIRAEGRDLY